MANAPCVQDDGLYSQIPDSAVSMKSFVSAYHRLGGDLEVLRTGFTLEPWQLYAAMAFYCANKDLFDTEYQRIIERQQATIASGIPGEQIVRQLSPWFVPTGREATDEEMDADLERLS